MHEHIARWLMEAGFIHYEVSAYAKEHHASRHNLNYWQFGDYLGIGAGAHSKLSSPTTITREMRHKHPKAYMESVLEGQEVVESIEIGHKELPFEFMLNALRLTDGFPVNLFAERTGLSFTTIESSLQTAEKKGLIYRDHQRIMPTELGRRFLNDLVQIFMSG
jgi:oxygen-independent coproporphyrinogen-3 oxidase